MDPQWQAKIEQDIKEAAETALPEDDEDLQMMNGVLKIWKSFLFQEIRESLSSRNPK